MNFEHTHSWSVDLSADGSTLAIGTSTETPESDKQFIQVYRWNGTHYASYFNGLPAGETSAVSLSRDGNALAVGLPYIGKRGGTTTVYKFLPSSTCEDGFQQLRISLTTDSNPIETRWTLQIGSNTTVESQSYEGFPFATFVEEYCIPVHSCIKFVVYDEGHNGMSQPGVYSLILGGEEVARGGEFDRFYLHRIGECDCPTGESLLSVDAQKFTYVDETQLNWSLSHQNQLKDPLLQGNFLHDESIDYFEECIPDDSCYNLNIFPAHIPDLGYEYPFPCIGDFLGGYWSYDVTFNGTLLSSNTADFLFCPRSIGIGECSSKQQIECDNGSVPLRIELTFDHWLTIDTTANSVTNSHWDLSDQGNGKIVLVGVQEFFIYMNSWTPMYDISDEEEVKGVTICKAVDACYLFNMIEIGTSGFKLFLGNTEIGTTNSSSVSIGESCLFLPSQSPSLSLSPSETQIPTIKPTPFPTFITWPTLSPLPPTPFPVEPATVPTIPGQ